MPTTVNSTTHPGDGSLTVAYADNSDARKWRIRSVTAQALATTAKNVILFALGLSLGFPTMVIPSVYNAPANATLTLTEEEVSWFGSINFVTIPLGALGSGTLSSRFGRKRTMQCLCVPLLVSWILFYFADSATMLCVAIALAGLVEGLLEAPVLTYISEISEPRLRGILSASAPLSSIFGIFLQYFLGNFFDWRTLSAINAAAPILGFMALFFIPESPHWLICKNRTEDTQNALRWLRGWTTRERIQEEYNQLLEEMQSQLKTTGEDHPATKRFCSFNVNGYLERTFIVPFILTALSFAAAHFTGITNISTYAVDIFNSFGAPIDGHFATVMLGLARFIGTVVCMVLIHYTGKRPLALASSAVLILLFFGVGLYGYFYLGLEKLDNGAHVKDQFQGLPNYSWFPMLCFIGGSFFGYVGIRVLPWILIGEVFPLDIRGSATGVSAGLGFLMGFIVNKTFFNLMAVLTLPGVFILYSVIAFASLIAFYMWLPETEGWSLVEVQEHFTGQRNLIKAGIKKKVNDRRRQLAPLEQDVSKVQP